MTLAVNTKVMVYQYSFSHSVFLQDDSRVQQRSRVEFDLRHAGIAQTGERLIRNQ